LSVSSQRSELSKRDDSRALRLDGTRLVAKGRTLILESQRIRANARDVSRRAAECLGVAELIARKP
jgi:hypothetical protein